MISKQTISLNNLRLDFVIPAYNAENTIYSCLESVLKNKISENISIIVVNNNSTDKTEEIAKTFKDVIVINCKKQGRSAARNFGLQYSNADYIAFIDSDVVLEEKWLNGFYELLQIPMLGAIQGKIIPSPRENIVNDFLYKLKSYKTNNTFIDLETSGEAHPIIDTAACIYSRQVLKLLNGFDENLDFHEDYDLALRCVGAGISIAGCNSIAYKNANRTIFEYILRTIKDSRAFAKYIRKYSNPNYLGSLRKSFQYDGPQELKYRIYFLIITISYVLFFTIECLKNKEIEYLKSNNSKTNLLLTSLKDLNGNEYKIKSSVRFYLGISGVRFFNQKFNSKLNTSEDFIKFFNSFVRGSYKSEEFEIHKEYLINEELIEKLST